MTIFYHVSPVKGIKDFKVGNDHPGVFFSPSIAHAYYWIEAISYLRNADEVSIYTVYVKDDVDVLFGYDCYVPGNPFATIPAGNVRLDFSRFDFMVIVTDPSVVTVLKEEVIRPKDVITTVYRHNIRKSIGSFIDSMLRVNTNSYVLVSVKNDGSMIDCTYLLSTLFDTVMDVHINTRFASIDEARRYI